MSDSHRLESIKRIEFSNPDQFIELGCWPRPLWLKMVSSRLFNKDIDSLTQRWATGPVNIPLGADMIHSLSKHPLTGIVRKAILKIITYRQIFWVEKNGKLLFSFPLWSAAGMSDLHTDILCWLSLLGSIFTPRDFSSVIFFTVGEIGTDRWPREAAKSENNDTNITKCIPEFAKK